MQINHGVCVCACAVHTMQQQQALWALYRWCNQTKRCILHISGSVSGKRALLLDAGDETATCGTLFIASVSGCGFSSIWKYNDLMPGSVCKHGKSIEYCVLLQTKVCVCVYSFIYVLNKYTQAIQNKPDLKIKCSVAFPADDVSGHFVLKSLAELGLEQIVLGFSSRNYESRRHFLCVLCASARKPA